MELEPRTTAPAHATGAVEFVPLAEIAADPTFRLRDVGDVAALAASIGRLGHLVPVELRPLPAGPEEPVRYQVVAGFRRLAALRLLARERVLARVHAALDDDDAWAIALAQARLAASRTAPWAQDLVDEALVRAPVEPAERERFLAFLAGAPSPAADAPEVGEPAEVEGGELEAAAEGEADVEADPVEVTPEELAEDLAQRMFDVNQDLAVAFDAWAELPEEGRRMIVDQARYVAELFPLLRGGRR